MNADLFASNPRGEPINRNGAELIFFREIHLPGGHMGLLAQLIKDIPWREEAIFIYGRPCLQPRLIAWYGDAEACYTYSGIAHQPLPWSPLLLEIKQRVQELCNREFNSALLNYYRHERDSMGMHSDDERELGVQPFIASLSLGAQRTLNFKHKETGERFKLALPGGSLLVMQGDTQHLWRHGIEKERMSVGARINITFRKILL